MSGKPLESDDDTSDEDYMPGGADTEQLSEVESDGDPESDCNGSDDNTKQRKRKSKSKQKKSKKHKLEPQEEPEDTLPELTEEQQKKKTDDLWADFLKDTDFKPKPKTTETKTENKTTSSKPQTTSPVETTTKPKPLFFAGEKIDIPEKQSPQSTSQMKSPAVGKPVLPIRKSGGLSSVLGQIGKKQKINTLEKSKMDWDRFKKDENITDELTAYNKGKNGYLDRQDFLERADLRQFELEKQARATQRSHRLN